MKYKYICNDCGNQFNLRSYHKSCNKCQSVNIKKQGGNNKKVLYIIIALLILGALMFLLKDVFKSEPPQDQDIKYIGILHEVGDGNSVSFKLITSKNEIVPFNEEEHSFFDLKFTNTSGTDNYQLKDNKIYPCDNGIRYTWDYNTSYMEGQDLIEKSEYVNPNEFNGFIRSDKAICKTVWRITSTTPPGFESDCKFWVFTDHPDNEIDSTQIDTTGFTYFTKGDNLIEISITGKGGPYLKQNEFLLDNSNLSINVWARHINYPNDESKSYPYNGSSFDSCQVYTSPEVIIEDSSEVAVEEGPTPPELIFPPKEREKFKNEVEKVVKDILKNPNQIRQLSEQDQKLYLNIPWMYEREDIRSRLRFKLKKNKLIIDKIVVSDKGPQIIKIILIKE